MNMQPSPCAKLSRVVTIFAPRGTVCANVATRRCVMTLAYRRLYSLMAGLALMATLQTASPALARGGWNGGGGGWHGGGGEREGGGPGGGGGGEGGGGGGGVGGARWGGGGGGGGGGASARPGGRPGPPPPARGAPPLCTSPCSPSACNRGTR